MGKPRELVRTSIGIGYAKESLSQPDLCPRWFHVLFQWVYYIRLQQTVAAGSVSVNERLRNNVNMPKQPLVLSGLRPIGCAVTLNIHIHR